MNKIELLAPAGNMEKLLTAFHFGADAVYLAGKKYGLRAFADNFTIDEMKVACDYSHSRGKKVYVTLNVFAKNNDFDGLGEYLNELTAVGIDAVIVSDMGVLQYVTSNSQLEVHISTQANTTNKYAVEMLSKLGASRVVLARELSLEEITEIHNHNVDCELESFVHGAMCISYSGRCLMSNYLTNRDSNRGECVQACRWQWDIKEVGRLDKEPLSVTEDERGTYIFNSRDMCMIEHIDKLINSGISSFKIEGRMKSAFYVATVVNSYRRAIDSYYANNGKYECSTELLEELNKASHRKYTTGFYIDTDGDNRQYYEHSRAIEESKFLGKVVGCENGYVTIEQRNKFVEGDTFEILSTGDAFNKTFVAKNMTDAKGNKVTVCNLVQQLITMPCPYLLSAGDIVRMPMADKD